MTDKDPDLSHSERLKIEFAPVMSALHRSMKRFCTPGIHSGISELAVLLDRKEHLLRHQFGPTSYDHAPTVHTFLHVIETLQSREAVAEIAALADCVTLPRKVNARSVGAPADDAAAFAAFSNLVGDALSKTQRHLDAQRPLTVSERVAAREALHTIVAYAAHLLTRVR